MGILDELHQDHINLSRLLDMLAQKITSLRAGDDANFQLIADVVDYIATYADTHHHPREDELYAYFAGRNAELDKAIDRCVAEHTGLKVVAEEISEAVDCILRDVVISMPTFIDNLSLLVNEQRGHLDLEEAVLFPLLKQIGKDSDWELLAQKLPKMNDPLFGAAQAEKYMDLYQQLLSESSEAEL